MALTTWVNLKKKSPKPIHCTVYIMRQPEAVVRPYAIGKQDYSIVVAVHTLLSKVCHCGVA